MNDSYPSENGKWWWRLPGSLHHMEIPHEPIFKVGCNCIFCEWTWTTRDGSWIRRLPQPTWP